jgi:hypothetical protein
MMNAEIYISSSTVMFAVFPPMVTQNISTHCLVMVKGLTLEFISGYEGKVVIIED